MQLPESMFRVFAPRAVLAIVTQVVPSLLQPLNIDPSLIPRPAENVTNKGTRQTLTLAVL